MFWCYPFTCLIRSRFIIHSVRLSFGGQSFQIRCTRFFQAPQPFTKGFLHERMVSFVHLYSTSIITSLWMKYFVILHKCIVEIQYYTLLYVSYLNIMSTFVMYFILFYRTHITCLLILIRLYLSLPKHISLLICRSLDRNFTLTTSNFVDVSSVKNFKNQPIVCV